MDSRAEILIDFRFLFFVLAVTKNVSDISVFAIYFVTHTVNGDWADTLLKRYAVHFSYVFDPKVSSKNASVNSSFEIHLLEVWKSI